MQMQHVAQGDHHHVQQAKDCPPSKESFMMMSMNHDSYADTPMEEMIVTDDMHTNNLTDLTTATPKNSTPLMKLLGGFLMQYSSYDSIFLFIVKSLQELYLNRDFVN